MTLLALLCVTLCTQKKFYMPDSIVNGKDSLLCLETMGLDSPVTADSVKFGADGSFCFDEKVAESHHEFYRLRIDSKTVRSAEIYSSLSFSRPWTSSIEYISLGDFGYSLKIKPAHAKHGRARC